eukprot:8497976-Pyramimonas_sp.AAC.1
MDDGPYCVDDLNAETFFGSQRAEDGLIFAHVVLPTHCSATVGKRYVFHQAFEECNHFFAAFINSEAMTELYDDLWGQVWRLRMRPY